MIECRVSSRPGETAEWKVLSLAIREPRRFALPRTLDRFLFPKENEK